MTDYQKNGRVNLRLRLNKASRRPALPSLAPAAKAGGVLLDKASKHRTSLGYMKSKEQRRHAIL
jgi:hypothetical protein